ncbi:MAG: alginate lyase family protein, partial [Lentisphaeria bacterium]|nr:alginate lyase family protein [Lentisphaeria bacterium]
LDVVVVHAKGQGADQTEWADSEVLTFPVLPGALRRQREWVVGIAWGAYHFNEEWGAFRNLEVAMLTEDDRKRRIWDALDLEQPELAAVRTFLAEGREADAVKALIDHFRRRPRPVCANPLGPASDGNLRRADETLARTYRLAGCPPYTFPDAIVWNLDPFDYNQWPIHLNRHTEWRFLGEAYLRTGDERYAREWAAQVDHWVDSMPVIIAPNWIQGPFNAPGRAALSLDAGIRLGQHWFPAFEVFRGSSEVGDGTLLSFLRSCLDHAEYLLRDENFKAGSNWGAMECNGLFHLGVLLPEFRAAPRWRDTALARVLAELGNQVCPDGAQQELAPGYHGVTLGNFLGVMRLARANDVPLPPELVAGLERMFDVYLRIAMPDLRTPNLNDSGRVAVAGYLRSGFELFPERGDFLWGATSRKEGVVPEYVSTVLPYAGWVVMRSGWQAQDRCLLFDAGPFGTGHQHEDKLGLILFAHGRPLVAEAGVYAYDTSAWRRYVLSTRAHSTIRIDGKDQNCRADRTEYKAGGPEEYGFFDTPDYCYARDTHRAGYGNPPDRAVSHRRRVLFVKPGYWIVVDDLAAADEGLHRAESQFLLDAEDATADGETLAVTGSGGGPGRVALIPLHGEGLRVRIAKGETEPDVLGFIPEGFNRLRPVPAVIYGLDFRGRGLMAFALVPFEGDACPIARADSATEGEARTITLAHRDGSRRSFRITPDCLSCLDPERPFVASEPILTPAGQTPPAGTK